MRLFRTSSTSPEERPEPKTPRALPARNLSDAAYLRRYFKTLLALALLCQRTQPALSCTVVDGQWNGVSHLWNVVQTAGGYRHVDLTLSGEVVFRTDQEMAAAGYTWDSERVPVCAAEEET